MPILPAGNQYFRLRPTPEILPTVAGQPIMLTAELTAYVCVSRRVIKDAQLIKAGIKFWGEDSEYFPADSGEHSRAFVVREEAEEIFVWGEGLICVQNMDTKMKLWDWSEEEVRRAKESDLPPELLGEAPVLVPLPPALAESISKAFEG